MLNRTAPPRLDGAVLRRELQKTYAKMALFPRRPYHLNVGRSFALEAGYPAGALDALPPSAVERSSGAGNPFAVIALRPDDAILDVGSGGGLDALLAARQVGPGGRVVGIDFTPEMVRVARAAARAARIGNITFRDGSAEQLPFPDDSFDVVLSNNVVNNLCPDKMVVLSEMYRVLKPSGQLALADVVVQRPIADRGRARIDLWTG